MGRVEQWIEVNAPVDQCFKMWSQPECLTCFMHEIESVEFRDNHWNWRFEGPEGQVLTWETVIDSMEENRFISWHSTEWAAADTSGVVQFSPIDDRQTRVHVEMMFNPPVKAAGALVAQFFQHPEKMVAEDLQRLKDSLEGHLDEAAQTIQSRMGQPRQEGMSPEQPGQVTDSEGSLH
jgi:uncharacterized membrane protein